MKNVILSLLLAVLAYIIWFVFFKKDNQSKLLKTDKLHTREKKSRLFKEKYRAEDYATKLRAKQGTSSVVVDADNNDKRKSRVTWTKT